MLKRYPLVTYVDGDLTAKVRSIQNELSKLTDSRGCLDAWEPHISVGSEVWLEDADVDAYVSDLRTSVKDIKPFRAVVENFGFIDNWSGGQLAGNTPYGVYLKVVVTPELQQLAEVLRPVSAVHKMYFEMPWPYRPHLAVAYKDLSRQGYKAAKELYDDMTFLESTRISGFSLAKYEERTDKNVRFTDIHFSS